MFRPSQLRFIKLKTLALSFHPGEAYRNAGHRRIKQKNANLMS